MPPIGLLAAWTYYISRGHVDLHVAALICIGFFFGGLLGAKFATKLSDIALERVFGVALLLISLKINFCQPCVMLEISPFLEHFPYLEIFALLILGGIGLPFPEDATLLLSGFLISHGITKPLPTFIVVYFGLLLTDFPLYSIGKKYGRSSVEHKRFHRILSTDEKLLKFEEKFKKWSAWFLFFGRHFVGLRAQIFLTAGVMRMSLIKFLIADWAVEPHLYL